MLDQLRTALVSSLITSTAWLLPFSNTQAAAPVPIASGFPIDQTSLHFDGGYIYFGEFDGTTGRLVRIPELGGAKDTVVSGIVVVDTGRPTGIARVDSTQTHLYFSYGGYASTVIEEIKRDGTGRRLLSQVSGGGFLGVEGDNLYYFESFCCIRRGSISGSFSTQLLGGGVTWPRSDARSGSAFYFINHFNQRNDLNLVDLSSGDEPTMIMTGGIEGTTYVNSAHAFVGLPGLVKRTGRAGGPVTTIPIPGGGFARGIDDTFIYFTSPTGIGLWRIPIDGSATEELISAEAVVFDRVYSRPTGLYWLDIRASVASASLFRWIPSKSDFAFSFTGAAQTFVVPPGVTLLHVDARGAQGGGNDSPGGLGGRVETTIAVTPGETLSLFVGGAGGNSGGGLPGPGGFNGGADGGQGLSFFSPTGSFFGGGGGGASDIRRGGTNLSNRLVVAGGGGGGGMPGNFLAPGGGGGGIAASSGSNGDGAEGGRGGTQAGGGAGGASTTGATAGEAGVVGKGGKGGGGSPNGRGGGGGGGGYFGGGGGGGGNVFGGGGGGGGSSSALGSGTVYTPGYQAGNGTVVLSLPPGQGACVVGSLSGTVRDATDSRVKSGATVLLAGVASTTSASGSGVYSFANLEPGIYSVTVSLAGYSPYNRVVNVCGPSTTWDIGLTKNATQQGLNVQSGMSADPVNTATGNYVYQRRDLQIPGRGAPFVFERTYNSQAASDPAATSGPLGFGWSHNLNTFLTVDGGAVTVNWGDGKTQTFAPNGSGGFIPQYGNFDTLTAGVGGTYTLRTRDLTTYQFDASSHLASIADRNGNTQAFTYTGANLTRVTDTSGRNVDFAYDASNRITTITDALARTIQFTYDAQGNLATARDARNNVTTFTYDANHQLTKVTDPRGNDVVTNTYDAARRVVTAQRDAKLGQTTYTYDPENKKTTVTYPIGGTVDYHDTLLRLVRQDDALGFGSLYEYDEAGNRTKVTDRRGKVTAYTYDAAGNVTGKTDALLKSSSVTYDALNNPLTRTDEMGNVTTFTYDVKGNLLTVKDALDNVLTFTYNAAGQVLTTQDARGNVTTNVYDVQGNLVSTTDALGHVTSYTYDAVGRRTSRTDPLGRVTTTAYDANDNVLSTTDPALKAVVATYDANNNRASLSDKRGNVTTFAFDQKDLLTTTTDPLGGVVVNAYDAGDRRTAVTDRRGKTTQYAYDLVGNLTSTTNALGQVTQFTYDPNGNRLTVRDALANVMTTAYDDLNRPTTRTDPLGLVTTTAYDDLGRVTSVTNPKSQTTGLTYDKLGRLTLVTDARGGTVAYAYDANGNRLSTTDPNGRVTSWTYDVLNRITSKTDPLLGVTQYQYDAVGNLAQLTKPNGTVIQYAYDTLDRLKTITYPDASSVTLSYDFDGHRTGMLDSLGTTSSVYDALGRMTSTTDPFGKTLGYGYDAEGNRTSLVYPGNKTVAYVFDDLGRISSVTDWLGKQTSYSHDAAGRLTGSSLPNGATTSWGYDAASRLTSLSQVKGVTPIATYAYTLDPLGNHSQVTQVAPLTPTLVPGTVTYVHDSDNRLSSIGGVANTHDANGNLVAKGASLFAYDFEDRLKQSTVGGVVTQYQYDGLGTRYAKAQAGSTTRFVQDLNGALSRVVMETDGGGNPIAYYVYGAGLVSRITEAGAASYYHFDSRGSTVALTDAAGTITDRYAYDPFGMPAGAVGATSNPFRFIGRHGVMQEGSGLNYVRARYYDPTIGRFINKDPKPGSDADGQSLHRYAYAQNNPVIFVDASGLSRMDVSGRPRAIGTTDEQHSVLLGNRSMSARSLAIIRESQAMALEYELESIEWNKWADIQQGAYDAAQTGLAFVTGDAVGVGTGLARQVSTLLIVTGHEKWGTRLARGADIADAIDAIGGLGEMVGNLDTILDRGFNFKNVGRRIASSPVGERNAATTLGKMYKGFVSPTVSTGFGQDGWGEMIGRALFGN